MKKIILSLMTSGFSKEKNAITRILAKVNGKDSGFDEMICLYDKLYEEDALEFSGLSREILFKDGVSLNDGLFGLRKFIFNNCGDREENKPLLMGYKILDFDVPFLKAAGFNVEELFKFKILDLYYIVFGLDEIGFFKNKGVLLANHQLRTVCSSLGIDSKTEGVFDKIKAIEGLYGWLKNNITNVES